jgi:uncharacterized protein YneF (UPF0154 family)
MIIGALIGAVIGAVLGGALGAFLSGRRYQPKLDKLAKENSQLDKSLAAMMYKKPGRRAETSRKPGEFDPTKHNSLQPANRKPIAPVYQQVNEGDGEFKIESASFAKQMPKGDYTYRFFGSQLSLGENVLISGLQRRMHQLEITKDDQVYIGGVEYKINPSEVEQLKRVIAKAEKTAEV